MRPAWGENAHRPARYDAAGRKPRAVRTSGGGPVVEDGKTPIYTQRAAAFSDHARTLSMEFAGYLRTAPAHAAHPGSTDPRLRLPRRAWLALAAAVFALHSAVA